MSFARLHKVITYLIAGLGLVALSFGGELGLGSELLLALAFVLSIFAEAPLIFDTRWIRAWNVGLVAFLALQIARFGLGAPMLPLVLELVAVLQISRLMNRRGAREHQHVATLALLHLIAATVLSTALGYAFAFLAFVIVLPWMLALSHLRSEIEAQVGARTDSGPPVSKVLASKRIVGPSFLMGTAALALPLFLLTGVLFLAFPRVGLGFLPFGGSGQRTSGFGADIELGDFGVIRTDPTVVLRVTPPDLGERPPLIRALRMRGTSFDHYDGRRWTRSRELRAHGAGRVGSLYPVPVRLPRTDVDRAWTIALDALDEPVVFLPPNTVGVEVPPRVQGGVPVGRRILHTPGVDVRYGDADGLGLRYQAWTSDDTRDPMPLEPDDARRYLQVPGGHERVASLARRWTTGARDDAERARMLLARLRESGQYRYSLETPRIGDRTPLDVFLFDAKRGHCEYFATALAIQLRTLGIPSRNVAGFLGGSFNGYGGYYALRQGDAHSWVEAWLPGRGWITLDPTPASRAVLTPDTGPLGEVRQMLDALRARWSEHIVGYDLERQVGLFRDARRWMTAAPVPNPGAATPGVRSGAPRWLWAVLGVILLGGLAIVLARRRALRPAVDTEARDAVRLYAALESALARRGHPRPPARTPRAHLAHLERAGFRDLALVREITERYLAARYGGRPLEPGELARLLAAVSTLR